MEGKLDQDSLKLPKFKNERKYSDVSENYQDDLEEVQIKIKTAQPKDSTVNQINEGGQLVSFLH